MFDLLVAEFRDKIVAECNASGLPPTVITYVLQDVQKDVLIIAQQQVQAQKQERDRQTQKSEKNKEE
jgi:ABC-type uncharacterized transport system YnjBCD ATPase subunit